MTKQKRYTLCGQKQQLEEEEKAEQEQPLELS